jgi:hypothetical protein
VTYLFDGEIVHRDSVGSAQAIQPDARSSVPLRLQREQLHSMRLAISFRFALHCAAMA